MKYILTQGISCGLIIADWKQLEIDGFIFLPDQEGEQLAKYIRTEVDAQTKEEAYRKAQKLFTQFLSKLTLVDNGRYTLMGSFSIQEGELITGSRIIPMNSSVGIDGNLIKDGFEKNIQGKRLQDIPLLLYSAGINSSDPFDKYRSFYQVLEFYPQTRTDRNDWIKSKIPNIAWKKNDQGKDITIISWIRHHVTHPKEEPLLISNPEDVELVQKYLPVVQKLAREIIRERENV